MRYEHQISWTWLFSVTLIPDKKRCPDSCKCEYSQEGHLVVNCDIGWAADILKNIPQISQSL